MTKKLIFRQTDAYKQSIELNGEDISRYVRSFSIDAEPGRLPEIRLDLAVFEVETDTSDAKIHLAPGTADLLVQLGWTPPRGSA